MGGSIACKCLKLYRNTKIKSNNHSNRRASKQKKNCTSAVFSRLRTGTFGMIYLWIIMILYDIIILVIYFVFNSCIVFYFYVYTDNRY